MVRTFLKTSCFGLVLCLLLTSPGWTQTKVENSAALAGGNTPGTVTLQDGGVIVTVDSFGRAGHNMPGCGFGVPGGFAVDEKMSVLCSHQDFFATDGAVMNINPQNCAVVNPITADKANHATSTVQCGACTFDFDQTASDLTKNWTTVVSVSGDDCTLGCYYSYTDFDVHGFMDNGSSFQADPSGDTLGQFVVRNNTIMPEVHYLFSDQLNAIHYVQDEYPSVLNFLQSLPACGDLPDALPLFIGDFTGALQFTPDKAISYSLGRDDSTKFP